MYKWNNRVAIVTGASSAVGLALCKELTENGVTVCALARQSGMKSLEVLKTSLFDIKGKLINFECDLKDEDQIKAVFRFIGEKYDGIDLLISNENASAKGLILDDNNTEQMQEIMETNVLGMCIIMREAVKLMKNRGLERKDLGHIVIIQSIFGKKVASNIPGSKPWNGFYVGSQHAVTAITEAIRQELLFLNEAVKITAISPGLVESDILTENANDEIVNIMPSLSAKHVSNAVLYAISVKDNVQIQEIVIKPVGEFL